MFNLIKNQVANFQVRFTNLFTPEQRFKTFMIAIPEYGTIVQKVGFDQATGTLRVWFKNGSCADFHGANWEQFEWLAAGGNEAFYGIRHQLGFFTQVTNPAEGNYIEYFGC